MLHILKCLWLNLLLSFLMCVYPVLVELLCLIWVFDFARADLYLCFELIIFRWKKTQFRKLFATDRKVEKHCRVAGKYYM